MRHLDVTKTSLRRKKSRRRIRPATTTKQFSQAKHLRKSSATSYKAAVPRIPLSLTHSSTPRPPWPALESGHRVTCITPPLATPPNGIASSPLFSPPDGAGARPTASQPPQTANRKRIKAIDRENPGSPSSDQVVFSCQEKGAIEILFLLFLQRIAIATIKETEGES